MDPLGDGSGERGVGRGRGRGSWTANSESQNLRRPHHASTSSSAGSVVSSNDDIVKNSTLSVDAAEFVPQSMKDHSNTESTYSPYGKHSVQNRIQMAREISNPLTDKSHPQRVQVMQTQYNYDSAYGSVQAQRHDQRQMSQTQFKQSENFNQSANQYDGVNNFGYYEGDRNQALAEDGEDPDVTITVVMQQLNSAMHTLTMNPGQFDFLVPSLINNIKPFLDYRSYMRELLYNIIQKSVNEGNFRYSGARLCTCLDGSMKPNEQILFRDILFSLCREETQTQAITWQNRTEDREDEERKCHGLILFLAELVAQMEDAPAFDIGEVLVQLINIVLKKPAPNTAKYICQALKLAGQTLEKDKRGSREEMENMMRALTQLVTEGRVDSHVGRMVHNVHELRNGNWGRNVPTNIQQPPVDASPSEKSQHSLDEPVLYGPDGHVLSPEERKFLQDLTEDTLDLEDHGLLERNYGEPIDDEEEEMIAEAYEVFLKMPPNKR